MPNSFIGGHPLHPQALSKGEHFLGNTALGRPHSLRSHAEYLLMQIEAALKLHPRVLGVAKTVLRQRQARSGNGAYIGVTDQGQNRVIKRRCGNLDSSVPRGLGMGGQDLSQQLARARLQVADLPGSSPGLFRISSGDIGIFKEEFIEPCDLRQHLQIGEVLQLEELRELGGIAPVAKMIPEFAVPGIAPNHVVWIGLKKILEGKAELLQS